MSLEAATLDASDDLAPFRAQFVVEDDLVYLDGNSLGRLPREAETAMAETIRQEWGVGLVRSWRDGWLDLPRTVGDQIAPLVGAAAGEVLVADQTSVNLYKVAAAGLKHSSRSNILSSESNFPSDLYVLEAVAAARGGTLRLMGAGEESPGKVAAMADETVGLVALSHVDYRSAALTDLGEITTAAHEAGALALWDLSHSVGVLPIDLGPAGADLAVGCTYKYLNGGPGAPAFLYVRRDLQPHLTQPIPGWFGHADQFGFKAGYEPAGDIGRFAVGTPPIVSLRGAQAGAAVVARAGIAAIRQKSTLLTSLLIDLYDAQLADLGFRLETPRDAARRGGHVSVAHSQGWQITQALIERNVIPDFRFPDVIRLGPSPLYTRFADVERAIEILADIVASGAYRSFPEARSTVT